MWPISHYLKRSELDGAISCSFTYPVIHIWLCILIVTIVPIFVGTCDLESVVASGHKKIWQPPAANMGFCDFKDVVAFGNNQLWRPLAAKVQGHHSGLPKKWSAKSYKHFLELPVACVVVSYLVAAVF